MIDLIHILAQADAHSAAAEVHAAVESGGIVETFGLHISHVVMQIISFAILAAVLWRFAFKPVFATIDERQALIASGLKYAEEMKVKQAEAEIERKRILQEASLEAKAIVSEARKSAEARIEKSAQDAIKAAEEVTRKAQAQIELDRKQMLAEARGEIARLVVATAAKVLAHDLSPEEKSRFANSASANLVSAQN